MIIFCILGFSIIFIALIIWIFGREEEDFEIPINYDRLLDKDSSYNNLEEYNSLEDYYADTVLDTVKNEEDFYSKLPDGHDINYRLSPVRSNYHEHKIEEKVNAVVEAKKPDINSGYWREIGPNKYRYYKGNYEKETKKVDCRRYIIPEYWKKKDNFKKEYNRVNTGYNAILDSPEWRACREWVFANKGRYCSYCKSGWNLRVHHKYYLKYPDGEHIKPWEYNIDCYMVLCDDCHKKVHEKYQIKTYYIRRG